MGESVRIESITLGDLRGDQEALYGRWDDPYRLARLTAEKRRALLNNPSSGGDAQVAQLLAVKGESASGGVSGSDTVRRSRLSPERGDRNRAPVRGDVDARRRRR